MKFGRKLGALVVGAAAVALPVVAAPAAQAVDWDHTMHTDDGDPGGRVRFEANGDIVEVCDIEADGWAVTVRIYTDVANPVRVDTINVGGNGNCVTHRASNGHDLKEGLPHTFIVELYKGNGDSGYRDDDTWIP